ncbi:MAG TPA: hypothetical protein VK843_14320 [Planctomycetota bacterium]|nr:hypothetical protein [Planctomycetota bacterium]
MGLRTPPPAKPGEVNYHFLDRFTLVHASIGVAYALLGLGFALTAALAVAWEVVENPMKAYLPRIFPHATKDTLRNAVGDTLAVITGWYVTRLFQ